MPSSATIAVETVALATEVHSAGPQARRAEPPVARLRQPDEEGDDRDRQVERQQPAQVGERAA